jgi:hypothetical protein
MKKSLLLAAVVLVLTVSVPYMLTPAQPAQPPEPYDFVYQEIDFEAHVASPRETFARHSITIRNIKTKELKDWDPSLDSRFMNPGYTLSILRVYDSFGNLDYVLERKNTPSLRVIFRRAVAPGENYRFTYEYSVRWDYDSYRWSIGWSTSSIIERARLKISVSDPLRIVRTYPAGLFSEDRKSAETHAINAQRASLGVYYPPTTGKWSILALLVEFPDATHQTPPELISKRIFGEVNAYLREAS